MTLGHIIGLGIPLLYMFEALVTSIDTHLLSALLSRLGMTQQSRTCLFHLLIPQILQCKLDYLLLERHYIGDHPGRREAAEKVTENLNLKIRKILSPTFVGETIDNKHSSHHFIS